MSAKLFFSLSPPSRNGFFESKKIFPESDKIHICSPLFWDAKREIYIPEIEQRQTFATNIYLSNFLNECTILWHKLGKTYICILRFHKFTCRLFPA